jgi:putative acetyltransferase
LPTIRRPCLEDREAILHVIRAAFGREDEVRLVAQLHANGDDRFELVAEQSGAIVGHVLFSPIRIEQGDDGRALGLAPLSVLPWLQHGGIGSELIRQSLAALREEGEVSAVVVLGDPPYYTRFGFAPASRAGLYDVYGGGDVFMALAIQPGGLDHYRGRVDYAPAFDLLTD